MAFPIRNAKYHHKVSFSNRTMETSSQIASRTPLRPEGHLDGSEERQPQNLRQAIIEELPPDGAVEPSEGIWEDEGEPVTMTWPFPLIPDIFTTISPIKDDLSSMTSEAQDDTVHAILPFLTGTSDEIAAYYNRHGLPHLDRKRHIRFLHKCLRRLPAAYVAADASRPWYFYWVLCALGALGEDVTSYRKALISTVRPMQNASGGFGSGHLQMSHLAPTYAIVCALAMVGGQEALDLIDRRAMWKWLAALKQPDGGFQLAVGGEEDVR
jgi:protein farnesyltransferase subunit beta